MIGAVPPEQSGVASGINTVMRTLGGALGGQLSATFIANNVSGGLPTVTGFTATFTMATIFLLVCVFASMLVPSQRSRSWSEAAPAPTASEALNDAQAAVPAAAADRSATRA